MVIMKIQYWRTPYRCKHHIIDQGIGADTDENGRYTIINVPIGIYDLKTSIIGYSTVKVTGLIVSLTDQRNKIFH